MVFHWSLSDSKSQISWTLLSILVVLSNVEVWMVSTLISKSSSPWINPLMTVPSAPVTIGITITFMFHSFFNSLARYLSFFSFSFNFTLLSAGTAKSTIFKVLIFFFFVDYYKVWSSVRDLVIRFYLKIPNEFVCLILQDRCWVVHIPFVRKVKSRFLARFLVDHRAHPVVSTLILSLC